MERYDAIIIGAGHNGLTAAAYLARAGLSVLVVEKNEYIGGGAVSREAEPGYIYSSGAHAVGLLRPEIIRDLDLARHGLSIIPIGGSLTLTRDGRYLAGSGHPGIMRREIARHSGRDADALVRFSRDVDQQVDMFRSQIMRPPPDPASVSLRELRRSLGMLRHAQETGADGLAQTLRFWTLSAADLLDRYFESDVVKAHFAVPALLGAGLGPMSPGTALGMLHHHTGGMDGARGTWGYPRGGMGAVSRALARALEAHGGTIRRGAGVEEVRVSKGRATTVVLEDGTEIAAALVVSGLELKRSVLSLLDWKELPKGLAERVSKFRTHGSSAKLNIALEGMPSFAGIEDDCPSLDGDIQICGTIADMERAYDDWKERVMPRRPSLVMAVPSRLDPTLAPPGKHVASVLVQYVPDRLIDGTWTDKKRMQLQETVLTLIEEQAPGFRDKVRHVETRTPADLEDEIGMTQGHIFHGDHTLDQMLFNRPLPELAHYRTPVRGYYLCGSSTHPGGGVTGAPGANAARAILADLKRGPAKGHTA